MCWLPRSASVLACVMLAGAAGAWPASAIAQTRYEAITPRPLAEALEAFAQRYGLQLIYRSELAEEVRSEGADAGLSPAATMRQLLRGTDLEFSFLNDRTIAIFRNGMGGNTPLPDSRDRANEAGASRFPDGRKETSTEGGTNMKHRGRLARFGSALAAFMSGTVLAQTQEAGRSEAARQLEEVVVTAQKREERLQDVPISMSVLSGDTLDRSTDRGIIEAVNRVPGVFAPVTGQGGRRGGSPVIAIRGASSANYGTGTTAYYLDSIPFGLAEQSFVPDANPYDLDRVEVLRGPQGTLYGASALNGVVRILTKNPDLQDTEFKTRGSLSSTDHGDWSYSGDAAFNTPIIQEKLAARVVLGYQNLGGWIDKPSEKDSNDAEMTNARVKLAAQLSEKFSVGASGWFSRSDSGAPPTSADGGRTKASMQQEPSNIDFDTFSLDLNYDAGLFAIKSATSYIDYKFDARFDLSSRIPIPTANSFLSINSDVFAEELLLSSMSDGPWRWTFGSMYRSAQDNSVQKVSLGPDDDHVPDVNHVKSRSAAVYGELTREFADGRFEVTGGLRYFRDKVRKWEDSRQHFGIPPEGLQSAESTFTKTTPKVVLTWHPNDDATVYGSYSKGFRSGLHQNFEVVAAYPDIPAAKPDTLTNYEIGGKASLGRLTLDGAIYYIDWQDPQQQTQVPINNDPAASFLNGDSISGPGVDLVLMYSPVDSLTLGLSYGWNDLTFDEDLYLGPVLLSPKGSRLTNSPKITAGASIDYSVALSGNGYRGRLSASANYTSEQLSSIDGDTGTRYTADSMTIARASFTIEAPKNWSAALFFDNVTNEEGIIPDAFAPEFSTVIRPRTYGVRFEYRYR